MPDDNAVMHQPTRAEFKRARNTVLAAVIGKKAAKRLTKAERDEVLETIDRGLKFDEIVGRATDVRQ